MSYQLAAISYQKQGWPALRAPVEVVKSCRDRKVMPPIAIKARPQAGRSKVLIADS
jgi:hypothetical protein